MAVAEDLTGKDFGYLKVLERATDHVTKSGQKKVRWLCECQLCKSKTIISAQDLKRGNTISCGCYKAYNGKAARNRKICAICGREFECPPSSKKVTCSPKCRREYARRRQTGRNRSEETKAKISTAAKGRDLSMLQPLAVEAAKKSPISGRFQTNINAIDWHLVSPEGKHYYFHSLNHWLREHGTELFGCKPDSREYNNVRSGLSGAKRATLGKDYPCCTYKGWRVIPTNDDK